MTAPGTLVAAPPARQVLQTEVATDVAALQARLARAVPGTLGAERWATVLASLLGFVEPAEARLVASPLRRVLPDLTPRLRAPLLRADLRALGQDPTVVPRCAAIPDVRDLAAALGLVYVMEGPALGGADVARTIERDAPVLSVATSYFTGRGAAASRWAGIDAAVERWDPTADDVAATVAAVRVTCDAADRWLDASGVLGS